MDIPSSQRLPQILDRLLTTLALEKFSYAVTTLGARNHQWAHDNRSNQLLLVFQRTRQFRGERETDNSLLMSVNAGDQILEPQDLFKLEGVVREFELQSRNRLAQHAVDPPVRVMVKFPNIGLQYPISHRLNQRLQMRFKNIADYQSVVTLFEQLKFPVNNAENKDGPAAPMKPLMPAPANSSQDPVHSCVGDRPSVSGMSRDHEVRPSSTIDSAYNAFAKGPLMEESPFFMRSHSASSETLRPSSVMSLDSSRALNTASSISSSEYALKPSSGVENLRLISAHRLDGSTRSSLLSVPEIGRDGVPQLDVSQYGDPGPALTSNRSMSETFGQLPRSSSMSSNRLLSYSQCEIGQVKQVENSMVENFQTGEQMNKRMSLVPEFLRPLSAPKLSSPENISQLLPPRRKLPFPKRPVSTGSGVSVDDLPSSSVPQSGADVQQIREESDQVYRTDGVGTTLTFPRTVKRVAQRQGYRTPVAAERVLSNPIVEEPQDDEGRGAGLQILVEREDEPSPLAAKSAEVGRPSTSPGLRSKVTSKVSRKRGRDTEPDAALVTKQPKVMVDKGTQTQTLSGRDHTVPLATGTGSGPSSPLTRTEVTEPPESFMSEIEAFVSKHKHRPPPEELWQRPGYAEASPEKRQAIISDFICENLDSEDFLKLCEDTENVWRRIGLEIRK